MCFFSRYQTLLEMGGKGGSAFSLICRKTKCIVSKDGHAPVLQENLPPCPSNHHSSPALRKFSKFLSISKLEGEIDMRSREQTLETRAISAKTIFDPHKNLVWRIMIASCWGDGGESVNCECCRLSQNSVCVLVPSLIQILK